MIKDSYESQAHHVCSTLLTISIQSAIEGSSFIDMPTSIMAVPGIHWQMMDPINLPHRTSGKPHVRSPTNHQASAEKSYAENRWTYAENRWMQPPNHKNDVQPDHL